VLKPGYLTRTRSISTISSQIQPSSCRTRLGSKEQRSNSSNLSPASSANGSFMRPNASKPPAVHSTFKVLADTAALAEQQIHDAAHLELPPTGRNGCTEGVFQGAKASRRGQKERVGNQHQDEASKRDMAPKSRREQEQEQDKEPTPSAEDRPNIKRVHRRRQGVGEHRERKHVALRDESMGRKTVQRSMRTASAGGSPERSASRSPEEPPAGPRYEENIRQVALCRRRHWGQTKSCGGKPRRLRLSKGTRP
jgi:hypothetical protein